MAAVMFTLMAVTLRVRIAHQIHYRQLKAHQLLTACAMLAFISTTTACARSVLLARSNQFRVMRPANNALPISFRPLAAQVQPTVYVHFQKYYSKQQRVQKPQLFHIMELPILVQFILILGRGIARETAVVKNVHVRVKTQRMQYIVLLSLKWNQSVRVRLASTKTSQGQEHAQSARRTLFRPRAALT